jgi:protein TonB
MSVLPRVRIVVPLRSITSRLARFMTGSMAVHALFVVVILVIPATRRRTPPIDDTMTVALAGPIASAAPAGGAEAPQPVKPPPAPAPTPPPKEAHAVREVPVEKPKKEPVKPKPKPEPEKPAESPAPTPPAPQKPAGNGSGPADHGDVKPGGGGSAVVASVGGGDASLGWYGAAVKAALEAVWIKPYLEDAVGTASVIVAFDIARDGTTRNLRIQQSSNIPSLDRSAQRAVIEASPLPAVPPQWSGDTIPVTMRFDLSAEAR